MARLGGAIGYSIAIALTMVESALPEAPGQCVETCPDDDTSGRCPETCLCACHARLRPPITAALALDGGWRPSAAIAPADDDAPPSPEPREILHVPIAAA